MADWIDETLLDPDTHLIFDGIKAGSLVRAQYTYCQGVVVGLETELAVRTDDEAARAGARSADRRDRTGDGARGVLKGAGDGDGGLFAGITARYLALAATSLPGDDAESAQARQTAADIVLASRESGLGEPPDRQQPAAVRPVLGHGRRTARQRRPGRSASGRRRGGERRDSRVHLESAEPAEEAPELLAEPHFVPAGGIGEQDLSVRVSGWMLMEAAYSVTAGSVQVDGDRAPVAATTSSTETPGASSRSTRVPSPARRTGSVMMRSTTP